MRTVIQRVSRASVEIEGKIKALIGKGLLVLAGFEESPVLCERHPKLRHAYYFNDLFWRDYCVLL